MTMRIGMKKSREEQEIDYLHADIVLRFCMELRDGRTKWFENFHGRVVEKCRAKWRVILYKEPWLKDGPPEEFSPDKLDPAEKYMVNIPRQAEIPTEDVVQIQLNTLTDKRRRTEVDDFVPEKDNASTSKFHQEHGKIADVKADNDQDAAAEGQQEMFIETRLKKTQQLYSSRQSNTSQRQFHSYMASQLSQFFSNQAAKLENHEDRDDSRISNLECHRALLVQALEQTDFELEDVDDEGNCQFDAVAHQLIRCKLRKISEIDHSVVRKEIVSWLKGQKLEILKQYEEFLVRDHYPTIRDYLERMDKIGEWGDEITLRAASSLYHVSIRVLYLNAGGELLHHCINPDKEDVVCVLNIAHMGELHYVSLKNRGDEDLFQVPESADILHADRKKQFLDSLLHDIHSLESAAVPAEVKELASLISSQIQNVKKEQEKFLGKKVLFMGPNGVGKSWILNLILLLNIKPESVYKKNWDNKDHPTSTEAHEFFKSGGESGQLSKYSKDDLECLRGPKFYESPNPELEEGEIPVSNEPFAILKEQLKRYCTGSTLDTSRLKKDVFFLPSQAKGGSTTPCLTQIRYGSKWELLCYFKSCTELQDEAYVWISYLRENSAQNTGPKAQSKDFNSEVSVIEERYNRLVADSWRDISKDPALWAGVQSKDIELHPDILEKAGKVFLYSSAGYSSNADRRFIRDHLADILNCSIDCPQNESAGKAMKEKKNRHTCCLKAVYAFVPCGIVEDGGQLADSPGTDDDDPFKIDALKTGLAEYETVVVILERDLSARASIIKSLCSSGFMSNLLKFPTRYHIAFLHYLENTKGNDDDFETMLDGNDRKLKTLSDRNTEMEQRTESKITKLIRDLGSIETELAHKFVKQHVTITTIYPTLFTSISLNASFRAEFDSPQKVECRGNGYTLRQLFEITRGFELMGLPETVRAMNLNLVHHKFFEDVEIHMLQIMEQLRTFESKGSSAFESKGKIRAWKDVQQQATKLSKLAPTKRATADQDLIYSQLKCLVDKNTADLESSLSANLETFFGSEHSRFRQALKSITDSAQKKWISDQETRINAENIACLRPSAKGRHNKFDIQGKIFGALRGNSTDLEGIIESDLKDLIHAELDKFSKNIAKSCRQFLIQLFESVKDSPEFQEELETYVSSLEPEIQSSFRKVFTYGSGWAKFRLYDGSLDTKLVLNRFLVHAEDYAMKSFLTNLHQQGLNDFERKHAWIADNIPELFETLRISWYDLFEKKLVRPQLALLKDRILKTGKTEWTLFHRCFKFISKLVRVSDFRGNRKFEDVAKGAARQWIFRVEGFVEKAKQLCTEMELEYQPLERMKILGESMADDMERAIVLDFDHGMFLNRQLNPLPFEQYPSLKVRGFDPAMVVSGSMDLSSLLSVREAGNESLNLKVDLVSNIQGIFKENFISCSLSDVDPRDIRGIPTTDLFSALAQALFQESSFDIDELKKAIVLEIQTRQHDPNPAWPYDPDLVPSLGALDGICILRIV